MCKLYDFRIWTKDIGQKAAQQLSKQELAHIGNIFYEILALKTF